MKKMIEPLKITVCFGGYYEQIGMWVVIYQRITENKILFCKWYVPVPSFFKIVAYVRTLTRGNVLTSLVLFPVLQQAESHMSLWFWN